MDNIIPNHKLLSRTELDTKKRQMPFSEKSRPCVKKPTTPNALLQKKKQKNKQSKQIRCLKTKATTKLQSNVKIFILQTYSEI